MFWLKTGVLSDREIRSLLGKKIFIYPFNSKNLKGATYNLTASRVAILASDQKKLLINDEGNIFIPAGETALIETEESIYVAKDICGTYHSRVTLVSKGLSHIGTTLDPLFFGTSLIAVHNHTKDEGIIIEAGESICSLMLQKMPRSTRILHDNPEFRQDIVNLNFNLDGFPYVEDDLIRKQFLKEIQKWKTEKWRTNKEDLIEVVNDMVRKSNKSKNIRIICIFRFLKTP